MAGDAEELANAFSECLRVDITEDITLVEESIEDTLLRLEEFSALIERMKTDSGPDKLDDVLAQKPELMLLFERILKLEQVIGKVKETVDSMEQVVVKAETDFNFSTEGKLKTLLKPLGIFKKPRATPSTPTPPPIFTAPELFNTKQLFQDLDI